MIGISDDYASIDVNGISFYYGYEETNENGEWLFAIRKDGSLLFSVPNSKLEHTRTCEEALLCGIEKAIIRGVINVKKAY